MQVYPTGVIVFIAFCYSLWLALSDPDWIPIGSAIATVFVALAIGGFLLPKGVNRKSRGL